jgi:WD40 repeat protein
MVQYVNKFSHVHLDHPQLLLLIPVLLCANCASHIIMPAEHLPPAQPAYVFRGHAAQIHALTFTHDNARLLSGDADGWVISWNIAYKRPTSVWKAHENAVLGLAAWGDERVIT